MTSAWPVLPVQTCFVRRIRDVAAAVAGDDRLHALELWNTASVHQKQPVPKVAVSSFSEPGTSLTGFTTSVRCSAATAVFSKVEDVVVGVAVGEAAGWQPIREQCSDDTSKRTEMRSAICMLVVGGRRGSIEPSPSPSPRGRGD